MYSHAILNWVFGQCLVVLQYGHALAIVVIQLQMLKGSGGADYELKLALRNKILKPDKHRISRQSKRFEKIEKS